ncbi:hypothetical protein GS399_16805 [Pedobacter sp. HMF7647]|uniref:Uncharacterized protein n=1 Tax=Hufsiella arboris TaxID=2695275 RepID=A0A7K1YDG3_9SPHI|nr:hypothetical protein [Hufsiella arboris]MXV52636.1 hypothetical protein [Hufsiella arboris]
MPEKIKTLKTYLFNDLSVQVEFEERLVHILSNASLHHVIEHNMAGHTEMLYEYIQADYNKYFGRDLDISYQSFAVELWGHMYAEEFTLFVQRNLSDIELVNKIANFVVNRTGVIDCGEREIDSNRIFWDLLSPSYHLIRLFIGNEKDEQS